MRFEKRDRPNLVKWACGAGCPPMADETMMTPAQIRARALRHAERTGHTVSVFKITRTDYTPEGEQ